MRKHLAAASAVMALAMSLPPLARAQLIVSDPGAIAQAVRQVAQQLQQIQQLEAQLTNQALMLQRLRINVTAPLQTINSQATQLLQQAQGIGYNSTGVAAQYAQVYPSSMQGMSFQAIAQSLSNWQAASNQTLQQAMATQNQLVQAQPTTAAAVGTAVTASQSAAGQTSAIQSTNQLLAALSLQLTQLQTILITEGRAQEIVQAQNLAARAAGDAEHTRVFHGPQATAIGVSNAGHL